VGHTGPGYDGVRNLWPQALHDVVAVTLTAHHCGVLTFDVLLLQPFNLMLQRLTVMLIQMMTV